LHEVAAIDQMVREVSGDAAARQRGQLRETIGRTDLGSHDDADRLRDPRRARSQPHGAYDRPGLTADADTHIPTRECQLLRREETIAIAPRSDAVTFEYVRDADVEAIDVES